MKVIIAAGGSGGHIFPAIALAEELKKLGVHDVFFLASKRRLDMNILERYKDRSFFLSINPMPYKKDPIKWAVFIVKLLSDSVKSLVILLTVRPDVIVGFGGYSSGSILECASIFRVPMLIHEQNYVLGRANFILAKRARRIAVSFAETIQYLQNVKDKVVFTGNPLRMTAPMTDKPRAARTIGVVPGKKTILIMGGSQGASNLNAVTSGAAKLISEKMENTVQFIHLTGEKDRESVSRFYYENKIEGKTLAFLKDMDAAYALADLVISRSGASALFELALYGIPMVLVPYPNPKNSQRTNAAFFAYRGAAVLKEEAGLSPAELADTVLSIFSDTEHHKKMAESAKKLAEPGAGEKLAREVINLADKKR